MEFLDSAIAALHRRGPDCQHKYVCDPIGLGHARLSIIDVTEAASQPFTDDSGRYTIVFNGELFDFQEHKEILAAEGVSFHTESDTEVLLQLYIREREACLNKLNGFFAFAIYDHEEKTVFMARDRYGIKPLYYFKDKDKLVFASEMKALLAYGVPKEIDPLALRYYFQNNYIPPHLSIFKGVKKLLSGTFMKLNLSGELVQERYYQIPKSWKIIDKQDNITYASACSHLRGILDDAVQKRLYSDVPLGAFLSGGIDSSVVVGLASKYNHQLQTYSIGYKDEPMFDETSYAELVAKKFGTQHTTFRLGNEELYADLFDMLDYIDEPFADSSALAVYILSKHTRKHVAVALSGDAADEIFGGYNKHTAEVKSRSAGALNALLPLMRPMVSWLPQSRNGVVSNKIRQIVRYSEGLSLSEKERYWRWCGFNNMQELEAYFTDHAVANTYVSDREEYLAHIDVQDFNSVLYADMKLVLEGDMLVKVDRMSMANSLEVRSPFLDYRLIDYAFQLPADFKNNGKVSKIILKDTFRDILPEEIYHRGKHGFEVPLLKWLRTDLWPLLDQDLLKDVFIKEQNIFDLRKIQDLKKQLFSNNPGDVHAQMWALLVFQYWWKKYMS